MKFNPNMAFWLQVRICELSSTGNNCAEQELVARGEYSRRNRADTMKKLEERLQRASKPLSEDASAEIGNEQVSSEAKLTPTSRSQ